MLARRTAQSADHHLQCIQELERGLLAYVKVMHEIGACGAQGHRTECKALFQKLGWDSFEQYLSAMECFRQGGICQRELRE